jgi:hypothetical protein
MSNFMKMRPVAAELFHADGRTDGRTDMAELIIPFRNFASAPKNAGSRFVQQVGSYVQNCTGSHHKDCGIYYERSEKSQLTRCFCCREEFLTVAQIV